MTHRTPSLQHKKVVIIEDERPMLHALTEKFLNEHFDVIPVSNGENGLPLTLKIKPDLVMLDIFLPGMDGIEILKRIRKANRWGKKVPVLFLTNINLTNEIIKEIADDQSSEYLVKSNYTLETVVEKAKELLGLVPPLIASPKV